MSSFKRRVSSKQATQTRGTRVLPGSVSTVVTSTGIPSLDDILGGGLPLTCTQLILAPDAHSAYGELVQKYFVAQGLALGHDVCIVDDDALQFVEECMWMPGSSSVPAPSPAGDEDEDEKAEKHDTAIKIAWRYESMKQFQTTVSSSQTADDYCTVFDLTCRIPKNTIDAATTSSQLVLLNVSHEANARPVQQVLKSVVEKLRLNEPDHTSRKVTRICIPCLGSPCWGDIEPQEICYFLHSLRSVLRRSPNVCASVSLPPHMCAEAWGGPGWVQKLGWLSDACISLSAFTGNPSLSAMFPSHHGFVHMHSLPMPSTLYPPSDKLSTLRGLTSSGENNLAFKCMRKRLVFETLHLDVEGGVGERRTTPATTVLDTSHEHKQVESLTSATPGAAAVQIQVEQITQGMAGVSTEETVSQERSSTVSSTKKTKQRKKVAFASSDRPDLYDF